MSELIGGSETAKYESQLLQQIRRKISDSISVVKKEKAFLETQNCIDFINGDQRMLDKKEALSSVHNNKLKKIVLETVSSLTDVRPIWNYDTVNEQFKEQSQILNKLARGWWKNAKADRALSSILMFSCVGGAGYGYLQYNEDKQDFDLIPVDPRDVLPIDPIYSDSIQDWQGLILRQRYPLETAKMMYPTKAYKFEESTGYEWSGIDQGRAGKLQSMIRTGWEILKGGVTPIAKQALGVDILRVFIKDSSMNTGLEPVEMGDPNSNWSYVVYPLGSVHPVTKEPVTEKQAMLYPRGRLIICTTTTILEDGPNPYWHGMFPLVRFRLDANPWTLMGNSLVGDLIPLQNSLNEVLRGMDDAVGQWVRRGIVGDQNAISKSNMDAIDTRRGGLRVRVNATMGEGFKVVDGPQLPPFFLDYPEFLIREMEENSGVTGLQALAAQASQMPESDSLKKVGDTLSPMLKLRSRSIEISLSELAEMLKVGFFQYYDAPRRMQIIGPGGLALEDFDYDPGTLVPDGEGAREQRAQEHFGKFTFSIAPNSFLAVSHTSKQMMIMQLFGRNGIDIWSMWDAMDLPDIGPKPAETIPERMIDARKKGLQPGPSPELNEAQQAAAIAMAQIQIMQAEQMKQQMAMGPVGPVDSSQGGGQPPPPGGGAPPPGAAPVRTNGVGPQGGRPATGTQAPQMIQKSGPDGPRTVVSQSGS